jgi:phosphoglycolate phosphatase
LAGLGSGNPIVVFDLDGTLAETAGDIIATLNVILREEGLAAIPLERAKELIGAGAKMLLERGFKSNGATLTPERLDSLFLRFLDHYEAHIIDHSHLYEGVEASLDQLLSSGYRLAVCTNKIERHSIKLLKLLGVSERFATIAGRDTYAYFKPDPRHLTETIRSAGGDLRRAVMVGDSRTDIDTARAAGIPSIGVPFGYTDVPIAALNPTAVIDHFDRLHATVEQLVRD